MSLSYLPGTASLLSELDKKLLVMLRDGRTLVGILRSVDQFANLVLHRAVERVHVDNRFGDIEVGVIVVRGENVVLLGEIDTDLDENESDNESKSQLVRVGVEEILEAQKANEEKVREKTKLLRDRGIHVNAQDDEFV